MGQIELLKTNPSASDFVPLEEHQSQTPGTFFGGKPVLYYNCAGAQLVIAKDQLHAHAAIASLIGNEANGEASNGDGPADSTPVKAAVNIWVTSETLILFNPATTSGASIPYPTISLHATRRIDESTESVYMQLELSNPELANAEEDYSTVELDIIPPPSTVSEAGEPSANGDRTAQTPIRLLYNAVVACTDLHPDPDEDDSQAGEDLTAPGAGGWITSENMGDFVDAEGNFTGFSGALGAGAGTRRAREDESNFEDANDDDMVDGTDGKEREDSKWQRTE